MSLLGDQQGHFHLICTVFGLLLVWLVSMHGKPAKTRQTYSKHNKYRSPEFKQHAGLCCFLFFCFSPAALPFTTHKRCISRQPFPFCDSLLITNHLLLHSTQAEKKTLQKVFFPPSIFNIDSKKKKKMHLAILKCVYPSLAATCLFFPSLLFAFKLVTGLNFIAQNWHIHNMWLSSIYANGMRRLKTYSRFT